MELTSALVLSFISLIYATPHDYGGSHVRAGAVAVASAFSGAGVNPGNVKGGSRSFSNSFSKSSASSFASSSASSGSFTYSGSGAFPDIVNNGVQTGKNGCSAGNCETGDGRFPGAFNNGAAAVASAGAFAAVGPSGTLDSDKTCTSAGCASRKEPGCLGPNCNQTPLVHKCSSGDCGTNANIPKKTDDNNDIQVNPHYTPKNMINSQSSNPSSKGYPGTGTICTSGTCGPLPDANRKSNEDSHHQAEPSSNIHNNVPNQPSRASKCTLPDCKNFDSDAQSFSDTGLYSQPPTTKLETPREDCPDGLCGNSKPLYEGPSSYNVPLQPIDSQANKCNNGNCAANIPKSPYHSTHSDLPNVKEQKKELNPNHPRGDISSCSSGNCNNNEDIPYSSVNPSVPEFTSSVPKKGSPSHCSTPGCDSHLQPSNPPNKAQSEIPKFVPLDHSASPNCKYGNCKSVSNPINSNYYPIPATSHVPFDSASPVSLNCNTGNCKPVSNPIYSNYNPTPSTSNVPFNSASPVSSNCNTGNCKPVSNPIYSNYNRAPSVSNVPFNSGAPVSSTCNNANCKPVSNPIYSNYNPIPSSSNIPFNSATPINSNCKNGNCKPVSNPIYSNYNPIPSSSNVPYNSGTPASSNCNNGNCKPDIKPIHSSFNPISPPAPHYSGLPVSSTNCIGLKCSLPHGQTIPKSPSYTQSFNTPPSPSLTSVSPAANCIGTMCSNVSPIFSHSQTIPKLPLAPVGPYSCSTGNCTPNPTFRPQPCSSGNCGTHPVPSGFAGSFISPTISSPKNLPKTEDVPYTGGFGAPSGILKPNDYAKPLKPFIPVANPTGSKPTPHQPTSATVPHNPPKPFAPSTTTISNTNNNIHQAGSESSAGAFASANSVVYTGGFGGPPGLLKPHDGKSEALTSANKIYLEHQPEGSQKIFGTNINSAGAGVAAGSFAGAFDGVGQGGTAHEDKNYKSVNCDGKCNKSPNTGGHNPQSSDNYGINAAGAFSGSGVGAYGDYKNPHSGGCAGGCSGDGKSGHGPHTGSYSTGLSAAGALSGTSVGGYGTSGSFASSSAVAHASAGSATKGGYGRR